MIITRPIHVQILAVTPPFTLGEISSFGIEWIIISLNFYVLHIQEYISSKSVQLLKTAFLHIDVTSASFNPISGGTSCTYVNHSLHRSFRQTNHIQPVPF